MAKTSTRQLPALTRERILRLAIERADARGLDQVSMRKLAGELSVTPMALYWHFANRDALLDAMAEEVASEVSYEDRLGVGWQGRLRAVLTAILGVLRDHPWLGPLARHRIVPAPNFLTVLEVLMEALRAAGYDPKAAARVVDLTIDTLAAIATEFPNAAFQRRRSRSPSGDQLRMRKVLDDLSGSEFPAIRESTVALTTSDSPDPYVKLGLDILVGGIESSVPKKRRRAAKDSSRS